MTPARRLRLRLLVSTAGALLVAAVAAFAWLRLGYSLPLRADAFRFERPWFALLLVPVILAFVRDAWARLPAVRVQLSRAHELAREAPGLRVRFADVPAGLRYAALTLTVGALMGPQSVHAKDAVAVEGIDIVLVLDLSLSMQAADVRPSRFEASKEVVAAFIERRPNDRIGAIIFGRDAYTLMPLTTDHEALGSAVAQLELETIDGRGTAIGNGIATGLNRLRKSAAKSKVVILLTDGNSNSGNVAPEQAAEFAKALGVKVFTVLMGQSDEAPVQTAVDLLGRALFDRGNYPIDPKLLRTLAERTGGEAFEVADRAGLIRTFHTILDRLERTKVDDPGKRYGELYPALLWPALGGLVLELLLAATLLRRWP